MKSRHVTDSYDYANQEAEYVVCHKNRPFVILVSPNLPTPSSSYIDHHLVQELNLKMTDISCKRLSFAGRKLRILGKVSFTMQCVHDGNVFGTLHFTGSVIENLHQHFDVHCVAGRKLSLMLNGDDGSSSSSSCGSLQSSPTRRRSPSPTIPSPRGRPPPSKHKTAPPPHESPTTPETRKIFNYVAQMQQKPIDVSTPPPPGFPSSPQQYTNQGDADDDDPHHTSSYIPVKTRSYDGFATSDPRSANISSLSAAFASIDLEKDYRQERNRLLAILDMGGDVQFDNSGNMLYYTSTGFSYSIGHGREKCCQVECLASARTNRYVPNNCGMHQQWALPPGFQYCSENAEEDTVNVYSSIKCDLFRCFISRFRRM